MSLGQVSQACSSRFAGMLVPVVAFALSSVGCGHSEGRDSANPAPTVTLGNEAVSVDPTVLESKKIDTDVVPASNELQANAAKSNSNESGTTEKPTVDQPVIAVDPEATRTFSVEGPDHAIRISFDDFDLLKVMNLDPVPADAVEKLPKWLKALDGKRVRVRGFMYPPFQDTGIRGFVLARDNQICCFGRTPKEYDLVDTFLRKDVTTNYIQNRPFDVVGIFRIKSEIEKFTAMYELEDAVVIEK